MSRRQCARSSSSSSSTTSTVHRQSVEACPSPLKHRPADRRCCTQSHSHTPTLTPSTPSPSVNTRPPRPKTKTIKSPQQRASINEPIQLRGVPVSRCACGGALRPEQTRTIARLHSRATECTQHNIYVVLLVRPSDSCRCYSVGVTHRCGAYLCVRSLRACTFRGEGRMLSHVCVFVICYSLGCFRERPIQPKYSPLRSVAHARKPVAGRVRPPVTRLTLVARTRASSLFAFVRARWCVCVSCVFAVN